MTCLQLGSQQFALEHQGRCLPQTLLLMLLEHSAVDLHHIHTYFQLLGSKLCHGHAVRAVHKADGILSSATAASSMCVTASSSPDSDSSGHCKVAAIKPDQGVMNTLCSTVMHKSTNAIVNRGHMLWLMHGRQTNKQNKRLSN